MNVIAIFDIGKTNKKLFLFDQHYHIAWERTASFMETSDEDGFACEDLDRLAGWLFDCVAELSSLGDFHIRAVNFTAYGASLVHIGEDGLPAAPLYNYLKPFPSALRKKFYESYGGEVTFSMLTSSPVLGSLNSGMQIYRIKEEQPELFSRIRYSLHLPQYLSYLFTGIPCSDITSIGCHTNLWNFSQQNYHEWVYREGILDKLAPILPSASVIPISAALEDRARPANASATDPSGFSGLHTGIGLHDSSAAIIPYLENFQEPFVLISTGTWCITLNPFNDHPLTIAELQQDCLCYLSYQGKPVKASRLFAGYEHEQQVKRLAAHFHKSPEYAAEVAFDRELADAMREGGGTKGGPARGSEIGGSAGVSETGGSDGSAGDSGIAGISSFGGRELGSFGSFEQAYHQLLLDIMDRQVVSTRLVLEGTNVRRIFVDGGFGKNQVYMHLLAAAMPEMEIFAASIPQATAMGAALAIHSHWNSQSLPADMIELKYYK